MSADGGAARPRPRLSAVVITWNEREDILRCLDALAASPPEGGLQVIVVDNGSEDGTVEAIGERHPEAELVRNPTNRGITVARNQGLRRAEGRYIAMLDSDAYARPGALERLCSFLDANPGVGMVGPRLVYEDGSLQMSCRRVPSLLAVLANRVEALQRVAGDRPRRRYLMLDDPHDRIMEVEYLLGAAMIFRHEAAAALGGFDERFGFSTPGGYGFDDADWALRMRRAGWRVAYLPDAVVQHGYRRRLVKRPLSRQSLGLVVSYAFLRLKHLLPHRVRAARRAP